MIFKKKVYNVIFALLLIISISAFSMPFLFPSTQPEISQPDHDDTIGDSENLDPINPGNPDGPTLPDQSGDEDFSDPSDEFDPNIPNARYPIKVLNYALDKFYNCEGYKSTYNATMTNKAKVLGSDVTIYQHLKGIVNKSGNKGLEQFELKATGDMPDKAANFLRTYYFEDDNVTEYITPDYNYNFADSVVKEMTRPQFLDKLGFTVTERPILDFSAKYFKASIETFVNDKNREYFILTASVINSEVWTPQYMKFFESTGDITGVRGVSANYIFYIYKDNAQIFKMVTEGDLVGKNPAFGVNVEMHIVATQTITSYNKKFDIERPIV